MLWSSLLKVDIKNSIDFLVSYSVFQNNIKTSFDEAKTLALAEQGFQWYRQRCVYTLLCMCDVTVCRLHV